MATAPASRSTVAAAAAVAVASLAGVVHAYRRTPHMVWNSRTGLEEEKPVEVVCCGERIYFKSNDAGHIVAEVKSKEAFDRLTKEIPEAYIEYDAGENVPTTKILAAEHKRENVTRPEGKFVLESKAADGQPLYKVLDELDDDAARAFATEVGITDDQLPAVLKGETLQRAIYNLLAGSAT